MDRVDASALQIVEISLASLEAYKVVGDQLSLRDYTVAHPPRVVGDWSSVYLQFDEPHSLGTVGYRWEMGYAKANLLRVALADVCAIIVDAPWMSSSDVSGNEKARCLKNALGVSEEELLMDAVGRASKVLVCRETESQWELVVPPSVLRACLQKEELALELKPNQYGMTGHARVADGDWTKFNEAVALKEVPEPQWILQALGRSTTGKGSSDAPLAPPGEEVIAS